MAPIAPIATSSRRGPEDKMRADHGRAVTNSGQITRPSGVPTSRPNRSDALLHTPPKSQRFTDGRVCNRSPAPERSPCQPNSNLVRSPLRTPVSKDSVTNRPPRAPVSRDPRIAKIPSRDGGTSTGTRFGVPSTVTSPRSSPRSGSPLYSRGMNNRVKGDQLLPACRSSDELMSQSFRTLPKARRKAMGSGELTPVPGPISNVSNRLGQNVLPVPKFPTRAHVNGRDLKRKMGDRSAKVKPVGQHENEATSRGTNADHQRSGSGVPIVFDPTPSTNGSAECGIVQSTASTEPEDSGSVSESVHDQVGQDTSTSEELSSTPDSRVNQPTNPAGSPRRRQPRQVQDTLRPQMARSLSDSAIRFDISVDLDDLSKEDIWREVEEQKRLRSDSELKYQDLVQQMHHMYLDLEARQQNEDRLKKLLKQQQIQFENRLISKDLVWRSILKPLTPSPEDEDTDEEQDNRLNASGSDESHSRGDEELEPQQRSLICPQEQFDSIYGKGLVTMFQKLNIEAMSCQYINITIPAKCPPGSHLDFSHRGRRYHVTAPQDGESRDLLHMVPTKFPAIERSSGICQLKAQNYVPFHVDGPSATRSPVSLPQTDRPNIMRMTLTRNCPYSTKKNLYHMIKGKALECVLQPIDEHQELPGI